MNCLKCGAELRENARFCSVCGEKIVISEPNEKKKEQPRFCSKCGAPLVPGGKFCESCGGKVIEAAEAAETAEPIETAEAAEPIEIVQPTEEAHEEKKNIKGNNDSAEHNANSGSSSNENGELGIILQIFGIVGMFIFAMMALRHGYKVLSCFISFFGRYEFVWMIKATIFGILLNALFAAAYAAIAFLLFMIAMYRKKEYSENLFCGVAACAVATMVITVIRFILSTLDSRFIQMSLLLPIWYVALVTIVLYGLLVLVKETPLTDFSFDSFIQRVKELKDIIPEALKNSSAGRPQKEAAANRVPANVQGSNAYNRPTGNYIPLMQTDRGILMYILLTFVTCGFYNLYFIYKMAQDANKVCEGDGKSTQGLLIYFVLTFVTCGIYSFYWHYELGNRLAANAPRYGFSTQENGGSILLWMLLGSFLCGIGYWVAINIELKNMNALCAAYNQRIRPQV